MRFLIANAPWRMAWRRMWRRPPVRIAFWATSMAIAVGIGAVAIQTGSARDGWNAIAAASISASADLGLIARRVEIEGRAMTPRQDVLDALRISGQPPLLAVDLVAMRERLLALPWVGEAAVLRRYPDLLAVRLKELEPFALWQHQRRFYLIARDGRVIVQVEARKHRHLPMVVGAGAPERAAEILDIVASIPELAGRVAAAVLVGERRWNLRLDNGIDVKLPEAAPDAAWRRLARLADQEGILEKDISIIDLRFEDRVVVRLLHPLEPAQEGAIEGAGEGKET